MNLLPIIDQAMRFVGPPVLTTYKRLTTTASGDQLTGRYGVTTTADTLANPQPTYRQLGKDAEVLNAAGIVVSGKDYEFIFSASALSATELGQKNLSLVQKDASDTVVLTLRIIDSIPVQAFGQYLSFKVFATVVSR